MLNGVTIVVALGVVLFLAFSKRLAQSQSWKATVTPLASIMGSGFLVCAPLLAGAVGLWAVVCMAGLLMLAYLVGGAIRFNIRYYEPQEQGPRNAALALAYLSKLVLAFAYFISVTYYLQLLSAFLLSNLHVESELVARCITSGLLITICAVGMVWGLKRLEGIEKYAVSINLGMIAALLLALVIHNFGLLNQGEWVLPDIDSSIDFSDVRVLLGLLIVVQGFETSRYLGDSYPAGLRIQTMRRAQLLSAIVYLIFISLLTVLFHPGLGADVTAIIDLTLPVAVVLPVMLSVAAIGSQFSASVADTVGAGGLVEEITHKKLPIRYAYLLILLITLFISWETDVNEIIAYASRGFALYYMIQCMVAFTVAHGLRGLPGRGLRLVLYASLTVVCFAVFALGVPAG